MKKLIVTLAAAIAIFSGCKQQEAKVASSRETPANLPMPLSYSGKSEFGSAENQITVMKWNKFMGERNVDSAFTLIADSLTVNLADGAVLNTSRDSAKKVVMGMMQTMKAIKLQYIAALPINVTDKGDEWVLSWTDEAYDHNDGKKTHFIMHEDYLLKNGKIRLVNQYSRTVNDTPAAGQK